MPNTSWTGGWADPTIVVNAVHINGLGQCLWTAAANGLTVHTPDEYGKAMVEWYWQGKTNKLREKTCPNATLSITNPTWIDLSINLGLRGERPATNRLSHGMA
jgi:hypothetical protein